MSIEAINWVLTEAPVPETDRDAISLTMVLLGLANHAHADGRHAFPSVRRLASYGRMSDRTAQRSLQRLEELGLICRGNQAIAAAHIERTDRRPVVYDLVMRGDTLSPRSERGDSTALNGVTARQERGDRVTPEPSLNRHSGTEEISLDLGIEAPRAEPALSEKDAEDVRVEFERFWSVYPRKVSKTGARRKFELAVRGGVPPAVIVAGAERYSRQRAGQDPAYTKHPTTWLHNGCWADEDVAAPRSTSGYTPYKDADVWGRVAGPDPQLTNGGWTSA